MTISAGFRRAAVTAVVAAVVGGGGVTAYAAMSSPGPAYRLATAEPAGVNSSLSELGTLTPGRQADVAFTVSGTVTAVDVRAGQQVTAGQTLGQLDRTPLKVSYTGARLALANANLTVANDIASQDRAAAGPSPAPEPSPSASVPPSASASPPAAGPSLASLQKAVLSGRRKADAGLAAAKTADATASQACAPSPAPSPSVSPGAPAATPSPDPASPDPASPATPSPGPAPSPSPTAAAPVSCAAATRQVLSDEAAVLKDLQALSAHENALTKAIAAARTSGHGAAGGSGGGADGISDSGGTVAAGGPSIPGSPVSAAQLAADQESADAAAAQVTVARQDLAGATVVSPISGTVVSVTARTGAEADAGTTEFEVAGLDSWQVQTRIPVADMPQLKAGQHAAVTPDGSSTALPGAVVTIGLQPVPKTNPAVYPVTIGLAGQPAGLHQGDYATVTITTGHSSGVSVPTSAVHYSGSKAAVTVYAAGRTRSVPVTVGTRGAVLTRITAGLSAGQQVVLANLNAPLPGGKHTTRPAGPVILGPGLPFGVGRAVS